MPLVVRLRSAVCLLGRFPALAGADLEVEPGEILLLAGPNGAGKTTLLRLLAGLIPLYSGEAEVDGVDLAHDRRAARRHLALVGHETFCYDDLTVAENLRFLAHASGLPGQDARCGDRAGRARRRRRADPPQALGRSAAAPRARRRARPRSAAPAARRASRRASTSTAARCCTRSSRGPAREGRTVLMASHELELARALATREVRVDGGRVTAAPRPATAEGARS